MIVAGASVAHYMTSRTTSRVVSTTGVSSGTSTRATAVLQSLSRYSPGPAGVAAAPGQLRKWIRFTVSDMDRTLTTIVVLGGKL
eukprot:3350539-Rhodomonas_salina.5